MSGGVAVRREEAIAYLEDLIKTYPGHKADFYLSQAAVVTGITKKKLSEYLKILHESGRILLFRDRFFPAGIRSEDIRAHERRLLEWLDSKIQAATLMTTSSPPPPSSGNITATIQELKKEEEEWYLVIYDIQKNIGPSKRVAIYRKLIKAQKEILKNGGEVERLQLSVWKVKGRQNALTLASVIPEEHAKIKIYKIAGEEKK